MAIANAAGAKYRWLRDIAHHYTRVMETRAGTLRAYEIL